MLNLTNMVKAPSYNWEVAMTRNHTVSAYQNARKRIAYVAAPNESDAKRAARRLHPEFHPTSARRV